MEKLLAEISGMEAGQRPGSATSGGAGLDARVRMFERLASEVARLNFYAARGQVLSSYFGSFMRLFAGIAVTMKTARHYPASNPA